MDNHQSPEEQVVTLRCNRCGRPITPAEAIQTPTGYRCPDCVQRQQKAFDTSQPLDYVFGFLIAAILSFIGSLITGAIGFFTFLLAPAAGVAIAEIVRFVIKKRRGKKLFRVIIAGVVLGGIPLILSNGINLVLRLSMGSLNLLGLLPLGYQILYLILAVPSAYYRLSGTRRL